MPTDPLVRLFFESGERATVRAFDKAQGDDAISPS
jgi:hypothetical protein